jgi:hypothetical protein
VTPSDGSDEALVRVNPDQCLEPNQREEDMQRFSLGQTLATPAALSVIRSAGQQPWEFLARHARGDWGDVSPDDARLNDDALTTGGRLLSSYRTRSGAVVWVLTEAEDDHHSRASTTILLPDEY